MGGASGTYGEQERCIYDLGGDLRRGDHLEDLEVYENIILNWICKGRGGGEWTGLLQLRIETSVRLL